MTPAIHIYRRKNGFYYIGYTDPKTGQHIRLSTNLKDRKQAKIYANSLILNGNSPEIGAITFSDLIPMYIEKHAEFKLAGSSIRSYGSHIKILNPEMNGKYMHEYTPANVEDIIFGLKRSRGFGKSTTNRYINVLSSIFRFALKRGYVQKNPCSEIERFRPEWQSEPFQYFTEDESEKLLDAATPDFRIILLTALLTGMRTGELIGLQWEYVDFDNSKITVCRSYNKSTKPEYVRRIPMHPDLIVELRMRWNCGSYKKTAYVFPSPVTGGMLATFTTAWRGTIRRAGIKYRRFHCTRHAFATNFLKAGNSMASLKIIGGWKSSKMVERYSHLSEEGDHLQNAINKMKYTSDNGKKKDDNK